MHPSGESGDCHLNVTWLSPQSTRESPLLFQGMSSIYNNPELEMMAKEIQAMLVEKHQIEKECQASTSRKTVYQIIYDSVIS